MDLSVMMTLGSITMLLQLLQELVERADTIGEELTRGATKGTGIESKNSMACAGDGVWRYLL